MITSPITGNLGNHLFQYAITRAVAEENGYGWGFNPKPEFDYYHGVPQMDFMNIDYGEIHDYSYSQTPEWQEHIWEEKFETIHYPNGDIVDYHPYQSDVFQVKDNTKLFIRCCQDARYLNNIKEKVQNWFSIKEEYVFEYKRAMKDFGIELGERTVVLNVRGGEYKGVSSLLLGKEYWEKAINILKDILYKPNFICITDDIPYANSLFGEEIPAYHFSVGCDYYIINNAKNLILSNSSFAIFPTWLNQRGIFVIAPRYWARHNVSTGYWANSDIWTFNWWFLDKNGQAYAR